MIYKYSHIKIPKGYGFIRFSLKYKKGFYAESAALSKLCDFIIQRKMIVMQNCRLVYLLERFKKTTKIFGSIIINTTL